MQILVIAEHDGQTLRPATRVAIGFAQTLLADHVLADHVLSEHGDARGSIRCLVLGSNVDAVAAEAARYVPVLCADHEALEHPLADRLAHVTADVARSRAVDFVVAASTTFAKDVVARAAGLLGGAMASDVVAHRYEGGQLLLDRPMYAGAIVATVALQGSPQIVTVRATAYEPAQTADELGEIQHVNIPDALPSGARWEGCSSPRTDRPDVTEARVVVSGGRAFQNREEFEQLVGGLADQLGGATGSSRALVDAGITPNEFQVGQTGKVVAPDLYIALGISGAVQHLAGMKNSKFIVAINNDPDAPIFEVADYGLVADVRDAVPKLIDALQDDTVTG